MTNFSKQLLFIIAIAFTLALFNVGQGDIFIERFACTWTTDSEYCGFVPREVGKDSLSHFVSWGNMTVIGNIYEHSNLLQQ